MERLKLAPESRQGLLSETSVAKAREAWLADALEPLALIFREDGGVALPPVRVSCGWPGGGSPRKRIGECWSRAASADKVNEIFISPLLDDPVTVLDVLVHELVHAVDDCASGHGKAFKQLGSAVGLEGKARSMGAGAELRGQLAVIAEELGPYPHAKMQLRPKKPQTAQKAQRWSCYECTGRFSFPKQQNERPAYCPCCGGSEIKEGWAK